jgi:hypothetical protein
MEIRDFLWFDEIVDKLARKHGVEVSEVEEIFEGGPRLRFVENGNRPTKMCTLLSVGPKREGISWFFLFENVMGVRCRFRLVT